MKQLSGVIFLALCVGLAAASVNNVVGDTGKVDRLAGEAACAQGGPKCRARPTEYMRNVFFHQLKFVVNKKPVTIRCSRALVFVGEWGCRVHDG